MPGTHAPILDAHRTPPDWSKMTYAEQNEHYQKILAYYGGGEDNLDDALDDHPQRDAVIAVLTINTPIEYLDRMSGGHVEPDEIIADAARLSRLFPLSPRTSDRPDPGRNPSDT